MFKILYRLIAFSILTLSFFGAWLWMDYQHFVQQPILLPEGETVFEIKPGSSIKTVARQLTALQYIRSPHYFVWMARFSGQAKKIKTGEYELTSVLPHSLLDQFVKGVTRQYRLVVIEGWTVKNMLKAIAASSDLEQTLIDVTSNAIMQQLGYAGHPEGMFYPDTYYFPKGTTDIEFLHRSYVQMQSVLQQEWENREMGLPLKTPYEALILASIVEKETGLAGERDKVSGVFMNRLRRNMKLQTDPTVIYGMGDRYQGNIRKKDLKEDTPYNTYVHRGLPPTPIGLPGRAALHATLHPAQDPYLYFVATGTGGHTFSKTLNEHNRAVRQYLKRMRSKKH